MTFLEWLLPWRAKALIEKLGAEIAKLETLAYRDELTGLPNRRYFEDFLAREIAEYRRYHPTEAERRSEPYELELFEDELALYYFDLNGFKTINDTHGHDVGDQILKALADSFNQTRFRGQTFLARLGGDEFVFVAVVRNVDEAKNLAERISQTVRAAVVAVPKGQIQAKASLGFALFDADVDTAEDLVRHADTAMYAAKKLPKEFRDRIAYYGNLTEDHHKALEALIEQSKDPAG